MATRFYIYARKSTDDASRQIRSIDDQIAELREIARTSDLDVIEVLIEKQTAKSPGRPVFNAMLDRIEQGEADGILAWHPDRLARNSLDAGRIIWLIDMGKLVSLKFPNVPFENTASGKFMLGMMFSQSKHYVDNLSENIKRGQRQKVRNGIIPRFTPAGYLNDTVTRSVILDPVRAPLIRKCFELYATGHYTLDDITKTVNTLGLTSRKGQPLNRSQYHRLLRNPTYYGVIVFAGELFDGKHPPIITKSLFDAAQHVTSRARKSRSKTKLREYVYRGAFRCGECGCLITTETQKGHRYLRCTKRVKKHCSQPYVREEAVDAAICHQLAAMAVPETICDEVIADLRQDQDIDAQQASEGRERLTQAIRQIDERIERLMDAYVEDALTVEEFKIRKDRLIGEKAVIKEKQAEEERHRSDRFEPAIRWLKTLKTAGKMADSKTSASQRLEYYKKTGSNPHLLNRSLRAAPRGAWQLVAGQGSFAHPFTAACFAAAAIVGETHLSELKRRGQDSNLR